MDLVIGNIDDAVYVTDAQDHVIFANQCFSDLLNLPRVFLLGQKISDVFNIELDEKLTHEIIGDELRKTENVGIYTLQTFEEKRLFHISQRHLHTTDQTVHLAKDVTYEQEVAAMKNSFINIASHQLRTPMTSIMLNAHLLYDVHGDDTDPYAKEIAQSLIRASERMIRLISDILNITKIQNDSSSVDVRRPVDFKTIFHTVKADLQSEITNKRLSCTILVKKNIPALLNDPQAIHEIVSNIVTNAVQYTPNDGRIELKAAFNDTAIIVSVTDTGIGIPKKELNRIYEQFSRAENAFEVFNEGTGLGLYLVKLLVSKIGGTIECSSKLDNGTTFTVSIPL